MKEKIKLFEEFISSPEFKLKKKKIDIKKAVSVSGWKVY
jgi:hypothetical protein